MEDDGNFKVVIVGGSIAGLTLAHCLDRAGIDYLVLEKHDAAPELGASIGIMPNGARILDQLGLFNAIEKYTEPLDFAHVCYPDGFRFSSNYPTILSSRFGYPIVFLRRSQLLETLYANLRNKSKVRLHHKVTSVEPLDNGIRVRTGDGSAFDGKLLVGADGVHSTVRSSMWQTANQLQPNGVSNREQASDMYVEYSCTFGISSSVPGLKTGEQIACLYNGFTILTMHGKAGTVFWFLIKKLDKKYSYPNVPRFTQDDAASASEKVRHETVWNNVTFGDLWDNRDVVSMTALEENVFRTWAFGRMICIGDSMHKMTPNVGQGANIAIENAAALTNTLRQLLAKTSPEMPSTAQLETALKALNEEQYPRTAEVFKTAGFLTRFQARDGVFNTLFGRYFAPYAKDLPAEMASKTILRACLLDCLDPPVRAGPYWKKAGRATKIEGLHRLLLVLPVLFIGIILAYLLV